jgi:RNA polymerase sigma factor (sigma-70 family)
MSEVYLPASAKRLRSNIGLCRRDDPVEPAFGSITVVGRLRKLCAVNETTGLVRRAIATQSTMSQKHAAFGQLVRCFQDMAYGYAYAALGNASRAEEAAQEAFIAAWIHLPELREPEAFPAWLRCLVRTQCHRLTRARRVETVSLSPLLQDPAPGPATVAERKHYEEQVWAAIRSLPEREGTVAVLFYISQYSRQEIGAFLGLSEATVKRSLASARRHLQERLVSLMQEHLREQRPSRDERFASTVADFTRQFSGMIDQDHSIVRSLLALAEQARGRGDDWLAQALTQIREEVEQGANLSAAMSRHPDLFAPSYVERVAQGEQGDLRQALRQLSREAVKQPRQ